MPPRGSLNSLRNRRSANSQLCESILYRLQAWATTGWYAVLWLVNLQLPILLPTSPARIGWNLWTLTLALYTAIDAPLLIAFEPWRAEKPVHTLGWLITASFSLDILINLRTAYMTHRGELVRSPRAIAAHYLRTMFVFDLLAAVPFDEILYMAVSGETHRHAYWLSLLRLPRFILLVRQITALIPPAYFNFVAVAKLLFGMLLTTHYAACLLYYLSQEIPGHAWIFTERCAGWPARAKYLYSFYRSFLMILGDRPLAYNNFERGLAVGLLTIGACLYAIIVSSMTLLVGNLWSMSSRHKQRAAMVRDVLRYEDAAEKVHMDVHTYFNYMATHEHPGPEGVAFLSELPSNLHVEAMSSVFEPMLLKVQLFADCERVFVQRLAQRLRLVLYMPRDIVYELGSVGHEMFLVCKGTVALIEADGRIVALIDREDHFGELALMAPSAPRPHRAVTLQACDLMLLGRADLLDVMRDFPRSATFVRARSRVQLEDHEIGLAVWMAMPAMELRRQAESTSSQSEVSTPLDEPAAEPDRRRKGWPRRKLAGGGGGGGGAAPGDGNLCADQGLAGVTSNQGQKGQSRQSREGEAGQLCKGGAGGGGGAAWGLHPNVSPIKLGRPGVSKAGAATSAAGPLAEAKEETSEASTSGQAPRRLRRGTQDRLTESICSRRASDDAIYAALFSNDDPSVKCAARGSTAGLIPQPQPQPQPAQAPVAQAGRHLSRMTSSRLLRAVHKAIAASNSFYGGGAGGGGDMGPFSPSQTGRSDSDRHAAAVTADRVTGLPGCADLPGGRGGHNHFNHHHYRHRHRNDHHHHHHRAEEVMGEVRGSGLPATEPAPPERQPLLCLPPQPFLGVDPLSRMSGGELQLCASQDFGATRAPGLTSGWTHRSRAFAGAMGRQNTASLTGTDRAPLPGTVSNSPPTTTGEGYQLRVQHPSGGDEDYQLYASARPVWSVRLSASGMSSGRGLDDVAMGERQRSVDNWLLQQAYDSRDSRDTAGRCGSMTAEQQLTWTLKQLQETRRQVSLLLSNPLQFPSFQAALHREVEAVSARLTLKRNEVLARLMEQLAGALARTEDLSQQVSAADDSLQRLEDELQGLGPSPGIFAGALPVVASVLGPTADLGAIVKGSELGADSGVAAAGPAGRPDMQRPSDSNVTSPARGAGGAAAGKALTTTSIADLKQPSKRFTLQRASALDLISFSIQQQQQQQQQPEGGGGGAATGGKAAIGPAVAGSGRSETLTAGLGGRSNVGLLELAAPASPVSAAAAAQGRPGGRRLPRRGGSAMDLSTLVAVSAAASGFSALSKPPILISQQSLPWREAQASVDGVPTDPSPRAGGGAGLSPAGSVANAEPRALQELRPTGGSVPGEKAARKLRSADLRRPVAQVHGVLPAALSSPVARSDATSASRGTSTSGAATELTPEAVSEGDKQLSPEGVRHVGGPQ